MIDRQYHLSRRRLFYILPFLLFLNLLTVCSVVRSKDVPVSLKGTIDLTDWNFYKDGRLALDGQWAFYPGVLYGGQAENLAGTQSIYIQAPGLWNGALDSQGKALPGQMAGTYRLKLNLKEDVEGMAIKMLDTGTSYRLWVNGKIILKNGRVGLDGASSAPQFLPAINRIGRLDKESEVVVEVANFSHFKGGMWESVYLGTEIEIYNYRERELWIGVFLSGSFLIMTLYHFGLFLLRRKDWSSLFFGLFCLLVNVRLLLVGERLFYLFFPEFDWEMGNKIEFLSVYLAAPVFILFIYQIYPESMIKSVSMGSVALFGLCCLPVIFLPVNYFARYLVVFEVILILSCVWCIVGILRAIFARADGAIAAMVGFLLLFVAILNDVLLTQHLLYFGNWLHWGIFAFIFSQSFLLSLRFSRAFTSTERLSEDLSRTNLAYSRFVPNQFLQLLNKESITDIKLGDQVLNEMTVLFSDIRSFTSLSEKMSPSENFDFLNSYLRSMTPYIEKNNGFIDKYIGDSIMALFPGSPDDALRAAADMQVELRIYNKERINQGDVPIEVGMGIHTGSLMLGTIGGTDRMEPTVISDAVNLASRIEGLTKTSGAQILTSEATLSKVKDKTNFNFRLLGRARVKGKEHDVSIYQLLDGYPEEDVAKMTASRANFEKAIELFIKGDHKIALELLESILAGFPGDRPANFYAQKCRNALGA